MNRRPFRGDRGSAHSTVCVYSPFPRGGHPRYMMEFCSSLQKEFSRSGGTGVELLTSEDLADDFRKDTPYTVNAALPALPERTTSQGVYLVRRALHMARRELTVLAVAARRRDIKVIHFEEIHILSAWFMIPIIRMLGCAVAVTVHNVVPHDVGLLLRRYSWLWLLRKAYSSADLLLVHSISNSKRLEEVLGNRVAQNIYVTPHGFWNTGGRDVTREEYRSRCVQNRQLLFFGAIRRNKGLHILLETAVTTGLAGHSLTIAGEPLERPYYDTVVAPLIEKARRRGVDVRMRAEFIPEEEIESLIRSHRAMVLPYEGEFEAQSGVAFMALSHFVPIISTSAGGLGDLLAWGDLGVQINDLTPQGIQNALLDFESNSNNESWLLRSYSAMLSSRLHFSWDSMAASTIRAYVQESLIVDSHGYTEPA